MTEIETLMEEWEKEKEHIHKILKGGRTLGCVDYIVALDCPERQKVKLAFLTGATIGSLRPFIEIKKEEEEEETLITISHRVYVDKCVAKEVEELNNVHNILTLFSCCGHGDIGYIVVFRSAVQGYNIAIGALPEGSLIPVCERALKTTGYQMVTAETCVKVIQNAKNRGLIHPEGGTQWRVRGKSLRSAFK